MKIIAHVGDPHGEREQDFGVGEEGGTGGFERDDRTDEQAGCHAGQAEEQRLERDLVDGFERREAQVCLRSGWIST